MSIRVFAGFLRRLKAIILLRLKEREVWRMKKTMELNKETASRLWVQQFGKRQKAVDFSGREIAKAAYNDRNSAYGWNVDHILPQSRGGKTADYNLICCHILTNDEKADKFPCFKANEKAFEIQKRQNHYEIIARTAEQKEEDDGSVNFLDAAQGLKCWKQCKAHNKDVFAGYVKVRVELFDETVSNNENYRYILRVKTANEIAAECVPFFDRYGKFLSELFETDNIFAQNNNVGNYNWPFMDRSNRKCIFTIIAGNIPTKEDSQNLLDDCIILNTYNEYFIRSKLFKNIQIACGMECYENRFEMALNCRKDIVDKSVWFIDSLMIDELVKINTDAKKNLRIASPQNGFYPYNFTFTKLKENLSKRI